jgi:hypothetical protein
MVCPRCGGTMKVIAFITDYAVVNRIIGHLNPVRPKPSFFGAVSLSGDTQARPTFKDDSGS